MGERKPLLIVVAGPNGSGKTTITAKVLHHEWMEDSYYINPDNIAEERFGGWNSMDAVYKAALYAARLRERLLAERKSMIFETVMSAPDKVDFYSPGKRCRFFCSCLFYFYKFA